VVASLPAARPRRFLVDALRELNRIDRRDVATQRS
jgi:hypothetical protein